MMKYRLLFSSVCWLNSIPQLSSIPVESLSHPGRTLFVSPSDLRRASGVSPSFPGRISIAPRSHPLRIPVKSPSRLWCISSFFPSNLGRTPVAPSSFPSRISIAPRSHPLRIPVESRWRPGCIPLQFRSMLAFKTLSPFDTGCILMAVNGATDR